MLFFLFIYLSIYHYYYYYYYDYYDYDYYYDYFDYYDYYDYDCDYDYDYDYDYYVFCISVFCYLFSLPPSFLSISHTHSCHPLPLKTYLGTLITSTNHTTVYSASFAGSVSTDLSLA